MEMLDVRTGEFLPDPWIRIVGDRIDDITQVEPTDECPIFDLGNVTILPGLIDCHTHLTYHFDHNGMFGQTQPSTDEAFRNTIDNCQATVRAGFTSVRDLGSPPLVIFPVQEAIDAGEILGPRIVAAGNPIMPYDLPPSGNRLALLKSMVRDRIHDGAQVIKVFLDEDSPGHLPLTFNEMHTLVDTAHQNGRKVAVHAHQASGAKLAVRAGADSIEHGTFLDDEAIQLMVQHGTFLVPTLYLPNHYLRNRDHFTFDGTAWNFFEQMRTAGIQSASRAIQAGVRMGFGTDAVAGIHGHNYREMEYLHRAGLSPLEVLQTATINAAELIGLPDVGELIVGNKADLIGVSGDPLDLRTYSQVDFVMKDGQIID
jgi:imidazolonepropionase-like amidohydrolase